MKRNWSGKLLNAQKWFGRFLNSQKWLGVASCPEIAQEPSKCSTTAKNGLQKWFGPDFQLAWELHSGVGTFNFSRESFCGDKIPSFPFKNIRRLLGSRP